VRRLLTDAVDSFEKLEIVVHVVRAGWTVAPAQMIAKAISMPLDEIERCIDQLRSDGVFDSNGPWSAAVEGLVQMYEDDRIEVFNLMTGTALDRVRKEAARVFADAFVIRPKKKGDSDG
jgi:hypothetical protein